jgi:tetratricopeptide (TPR) repeat protein
MKTKLLVVLFLLILASSCSLINSSLEFTKGTKCLDKGDHSAAVLHLENAVRLNPNYSKIHNNLGCAYYGVNNVEKSWYHLRQVVLLDANNREAALSFKELSREVFRHCQIDEGMSLDEVIHLLGEPDYIFDTPKGKVYFYGTIGLEFVDGKLKTAIDVL